VEGLALLVAERLPSNDKYGDLSDGVQVPWVHAVLTPCIIDRFRRNCWMHGIVYFDTVEVVWKRLGVRATDSDLKRPS
jgi:hypothetical protein